jgi:PleD family two-component response regulator
MASLLPGQAVNSLFDRVDKALYRARENGRNRVELDINDEMEEKRD